MPKEIIYNKHGNTPDSTEYVQVGWDKHGGVQVGSVSPNGKIMLLDKESGEHVASGDLPGFFIDLDRKGINELIQVLRRARDAAFGADA